MQRALMQYRLPQNYDLVYKALKKSGRDDLIGFHEEALIRPRNARPQNSFKNKEKSNSNYKSNDKSKNTTNKKTQRKKTIRNVHKKK